MLCKANVNGKVLENCNFFAIIEDDVISKIGLEDKKLLLYDDFYCWDEGALIGKASQGAIRSLRKSN